MIGLVVIAAEHADPGLAQTRDAGVCAFRPHPSITLQLTGHGGLRFQSVLFPTFRRDAVAAHRVHPSQRLRPLRRGAVGLSSTHRLPAALTGLADR